MGVDAASARRTCLFARIYGQDINEFRLWDCEADVKSMSCLRLTRQCTLRILEICESRFLSSLRPFKTPIQYGGLTV